MDSGTLVAGRLGAKIRLQQATFDPLLKASPVPPELTWSSIDEQRPQKYYLVQFHGPILSDWREQLEQAGAEVLDYIPDCRPRYSTIDLKHSNPESGRHDLGALIDPRGLGPADFQPLSTIRNWPCMMAK